MAPRQDRAGLTKYCRAVRAVDDLSFTATPGRVTGFLGPNGSGETTTLRMVINLVTPTAGTATISGRRYVDLEQPLRHVGAVRCSEADQVEHLVGAAAREPGRRADKGLRPVRPRWALDASTTPARCGCVLPKRTSSPPPWRGRHRGAHR
jgi:energy-coupling factor transporter ATP-binding protein EcfA2